MLWPKNAIDYKSNVIIKELHMQVYQFTNGQEIYLIEARNVLGARQRLQDKGVNPGHFTLVSIECGDEFPTD
ncbi:MAG: hypothetical protein JO170_09615 [Verrucomicrobia bacterium]|nr:hypothetical protein [Verrucomicrobiota bacterium]